MNCKVSKFLRLESECLNDSEIAVWCFMVDRTNQLADEFWSVLSNDEREKAESFVFESDRTLYIIAHGALRVVAELLTGIDADKLVFDTRLNGKPYIKGSNVRFNLSHAKGIVICGFSRGLEIGVDVEPVNLEFDWKGIAKSYFTKSELASIEMHPEEEQSKAFFRCWTRKEACLKATGIGLIAPLNSFEVPVAASISDATVSLQRHPETPIQLKLNGLNAPAPYVAAIAHEMTDKPIAIRFNEIEI